MSIPVEVYYDFRSPYAYFTWHRLRAGDVAVSELVWRWRPVSTDVLLNLQAEREPWAPYRDVLCPAKRAHLIADVGRLAAYYGAPLRRPNPSRPDPIAALCLALLLDETEQSAFNAAVFSALWEQQQDISAREVLAQCLASTGARTELLEVAFGESTRAALTEETVAAYGRGIFGVPSFAWNDETFFGNDRLDLLLWHVEQRNHVR